MTSSFGLGPSPGPDRLGRYVPLLQAFLEERAQLPGLAVLPAGTFSEVADGLAAGSLTFGWLSAATFARVEPSGTLRLLLQAIRADSSRYYGVLFVRASAPVHTLGDLAGRRIAWVSRDSSAGYLLAAHALAESGIRPGGETFTGSHAAAVQAVAAGEADAGATFCSIDPRGKPNRIRSAGWTETVAVAGVAFRPVATFGPIPGDLLCAGPRTTYGERALFSTAMARMHLHPEGARIVRGLFGADRFDVALPGDLQLLREAAAGLGWH